MPSKRNRKTELQDNDSTQSEHNSIIELRQLLNDHNGELNDHHKMILQQQKMVYQAQEAVEKKLKIHKQTCNQKFQDLRSLCNEIQKTIDAQLKEQELLTNHALDRVNDGEMDHAGLLPWEICALKFRFRFWFNQ